jgi:hypothetical protein
MEASMGLFSKRPQEDSAEQRDHAWLYAGHQRFDRDKNRIFGSPETMRVVVSMSIHRRQEVREPAY